MKILMVNTEYARGGAALVARALHKAANDSPGIESLFAYGRGPKNQDKQVKRFALSIEVYLHALLTRVAGIQGYGTYFSTKRLLRIIQEWRPDVIHFQNIHGYYLNLNIARMLKKLEIPVVWTLHDAWPLTGRCTYFFDCSRWRNGCGDCPYPRNYPKTYFDTSRMMWAKKRVLLGGVWAPMIVTPSKWLAAQVSEACAGSCRAEVIPNGIDTKVFRPQNQAHVRKELGLPDNKKILLLAASDLKAERKGAHYFFESLGYVEAEDWMVAIVGKTVDPQQAHRARVDIKHLGYLKGSESMAKAYSASDIFCITSLDENFPTTVLESMSCGTPVVGFSVGGIPEQVTEDCGEIVTARDAEALGRAITGLLVDGELRRKMGVRCREKAVSEYNIERFVERYIALYHKLGGGCGPRGNN